MFSTHSSLSKMKFLLEFNSNKMIRVCTFEKDAETVYLNEAKTAWIILRKLPETAHKNFETLWGYKPKEKGKVIMEQNGKNVNHTCDRWHQSYLNTPKWEPNANYSYMFSGTSGIEKKEVPKEFQELLDLINTEIPESKHYNQVVGNWYETGEDYIPFHSDYPYSTTPGTGVIIVNFVKSEKVLRTFVLKAKQGTDHIYSRIEIPLYNGAIIEMHGNTQDLYRHSVPKVLGDNPGPRVSVSFRSFTQEN